MNEKEFTLWLKGFMDAFDESVPNQKQFDMIKEKLNSINQPSSYTISVGEPNRTWITTNTGQINLPPQCTGEVGTSDKQLLND